MKYKMTVEEFFEEDYKFVDGDTYADTLGGVVRVGADVAVKTSNVRCDDDDKRFVISAKALEDESRTKESTAIETLDKLGYTWNGGQLWKPPVGEKYDFTKRTKVSYEKVKFDKLSKAFEEHEKAQLYGASQSIPLTEDEVFKRVKFGLGVYRKVETEITPMQAAKDACVAFLDDTGNDQVGRGASFTSFLTDSDTSTDDMWCMEYLDICRAMVNAYDGK